MLTSFTSLPAVGKHVVAVASEIPAGRQSLFTVEGREIAVFNVNGDFYALLNRCPHEGGSLCHGDRVGLVQSDGPGSYRYSRAGEFVKCPWHAWEFDIKTGLSWCDPRRTRVRTYEVAVELGAALVQGPYVAERFAVEVVDKYIVINL